MRSNKLNELTGLKELRLTIALIYLEECFRTVELAIKEGYSAKIRFPHDNELPTLPVHRRPK